LLHRRYVRGLADIRRQNDMCAVLRDSTLCDNFLQLVFEIDLLLHELPVLVERLIIGIDD
jgi:hypothetical protein